jgi:cytoskeletal protein CcmA (bactofilin family)
MTLRLPRVFALGFLAVMALGVVSVFAGPAGAQTVGDFRDRDRRIAVGTVVVNEGEDIDGPIASLDGDSIVRGTGRDGVLVIDGDARIASSGRIIGDVVVIDGDAFISGRVNGDITVWQGRAVIREGATVRGDVRSTDKPTVERGAEVTGEVKEADLPGTISFLGVRVLGFFWLAVTVSTGVLGLLFVLLMPRAAQKTARVARESTGKSVGVGLLVMIGLPIVAVIALITIVGIPFGLGLLGALGLIHAIAYVVGALWLGRFMVKEPKSAIGAFFAGWAILRVIALIPGVGVLGWIVAVVIGGGAITIALFRSGRGPLEPPPERTVPPAGEVPPATDETTDAGATSWSADEKTATDEPAPATATTTEPGDTGGGTTTEPMPAAPAKAPAKKAAPAKTTKATKKTT